MSVGPRGNWAPHSINQILVDAAPALSALPAEEFLMHLSDGNSEFAKSHGGGANQRSTPRRAPPIA